MAVCGSSSWEEGGLEIVLSKVDCPCSANTIMPPELRNHVTICSFMLSFHIILLDWYEPRTRLRCCYIMVVRVHCRSAASTSVVLNPTYSSMNGVSSPTQHGTVYTAPMARDLSDASVALQLLVVGSKPLTIVLVVLKPLSNSDAI